MSDERKNKIDGVEVIEVYVTYLCSNPNCQNTGSSRKDKRNYEEVTLLSGANIPDHIICTSCGSPMDRI